ncbi:MAG TPA: hypothetical protein VK163_11175 [Opitutaceae bacterium]|nr:hypothetical protein [Opitutaceae bacterium]
MPPRAARHVALRLLPLLLVAALVEPARAADTPSAPPAQTPAAAPTDPADLGRGLRYLRLGAPDDDASFAAANAAAALVVDLRESTPGDRGATRLRELLARRDAARPLLFLLGTATPNDLRAIVPRDTAGVLTIATKASGIPAEVIVEIDAAQERAALEAHTAGRPARELIETKIEKQRFDEARLAHDHANGARERDATPVAKPDAKPTEPASAPLQDVLLQRAVAIHRALLALGRIPEHT